MVLLPRATSVAGMTNLSYQGWLGGSFIFPVPFVWSVFCGVPPVQLLLPDSRSPPRRGSAGGSYLSLNRPWSHYSASASGGHGIQIEDNIYTNCSAVLARQSGFLSSSPDHHTQSSFWSWGWRRSWCLLGTPLVSCKPSPAGLTGGLMVGLLVEPLPLLPLATHPRCGKDSSDRPQAAPTCRTCVWGRVR